MNRRRSGIIAVVALVVTCSSGAQSAVHAGGVLQIVSKAPLAAGPPMRGTDGRIYALEPRGFKGSRVRVDAFGADGSVISVTIPGYGLSTATMDDKNVVYAAGQSSILSALDVGDQHVLWSVPSGSRPVTRPAWLGNDTVSVIGADNKLYSFFTLDGSLQRTMALSTTASFVDLVSSSDHTALYALDGSGVLSAIGPEGPLWATPLRANPTTLTVLSSGTIVATGAVAAEAVRPNGTRSWRYTPHSGRLGSVVSPPVEYGSRGLLLARTWDASAIGNLALVSYAGVQLWASHDSRVAQLAATPAVDPQGDIYVGTYDGRILGISPKDGSGLWQFSLPRNATYESDVRSMIVRLDGSVWVSAGGFVYILGVAPAFTLPMTITPQPAKGTRIGWTWKWTGAQKPDSYIAVVYHYTGKTSFGDQQVALPVTATGLATTGKCGRTYYLRIRAVGATFPPTYYAPADAITLTC